MAIMGGPRNGSIRTSPRFSVIGTAGSEEQPLHGNYIDGEWMMARGGRTLRNRNPAHVDMILGEFPDSTAADVADAVAAANRAYPAWRALPMPQRAEILFRTAELV